MTPCSPRRSDEGVKVLGWGEEGAGRGRWGANRRPQSPRGRERGAPAESWEPRSAPGWGRRPSAVERQRARPSPSPSPSPAGGAAPTMEPDHSPRKIQFTVPLLEPHLDPEAAEQVRGRAG